jgi:DNA-binding GntR family transcriptional regulator
MSEISNEPPQVRDRVYRYLRQSIVAGNLRSGSRLVEDRISEQLDVSRTPVREAIQRLTSDGLVTRVRRGQVEVRYVEQSERDQLHLLRVAFDEVAARLITARVGSISWDDLYARLSVLEDAFAHGVSSPEMSVAHLDFHLAINSAAFDDSVAALVTSQAFLYAIDPKTQPADYDPVAHHRMLLDALRSGDETVALEAVRDHAVLVTPTEHSYN